MDASISILYPSVESKLLGNSGGGYHLPHIRANVCARRTRCLGTGPPDSCFSCRISTSRILLHHFGASRYGHDPVGHVDITPRQSDGFAANKTEAGSSLLPRWRLTRRTQWDPWIYVAEGERIYTIEVFPKQTLTIDLDLCQLTK
jgi:hypothetical protein